MIDGEIYSTKKQEKGDIKSGTSEVQRSSNKLSEFVMVIYIRALIRRTIARRFTWYGMTKDIEEVVKRCDVCQRMNRKLATVTPKMHPVPIKSPWQRLETDFIGPMAHKPSSGNRMLYSYCMSVVI